MLHTSIIISALYGALRDGNSLSNFSSGLSKYHITLFNDHR